MQLNELKIGDFTPNFTNDFYIHTAVALIQTDLLNGDIDGAAKTAALFLRKQTPFTGRRKLFLQLILAAGVGTIEFVKALQDVYQTLQTTCRN